MPAAFLPVALLLVLVAGCDRSPMDSDDTPSSEIPSADVQPPPDQAALESPPSEFVIRDLFFDVFFASDRRESTDRGRAFHTFTFTDMENPERRYFQALRAINEHHLPPGEGFPPRSHAHMEILTWVIDGELRHRDFEDRQEIITPRRFQRINAGSRFLFSTFNPSETADAHYIEIWMRPNDFEADHRYDAVDLDPAERQGQFQKLAGPDGNEAPVEIFQDARLFAIDLTDGQDASFAQTMDRALWIHVATGSVQIGRYGFGPGDGLAVTGRGDVQMTALEASQVLLVDLERWE